MSEEIKEEAQDMDLDQNALDQISGGVPARVSDKEQVRKTTDKGNGDIVLPEI